MTDDSITKKHIDEIKFSSRKELLAEINNINNKCIM